MRISLQLLLGYVLVAILASYLVFIVFLREVKPTVRNATESMLNDTSTILATIVSQELTTLDELQYSPFGEAVAHVSKKLIQSNIDGMIKNKIAYQIYITNDEGIVIFDSNNHDIGKDYSQWNDVYLTLQGKYGARITRIDKNDIFSSVMYVGAPIKIDNKIVGVLTVSKPMPNMLTIINKGQQHIILGGIILIISALIVGGFVVCWVNHSMKKLVTYAKRVSCRENVVLPKFFSPELKALANAIEDMRIKLDGKDYIEKYVHTLAHELKSPLSSIRVATEMLHDSTDKLLIECEHSVEIKEKQDRFLGNIDHQTERMMTLIQRMLELARLESRAGVHFEFTNIAQIVTQIIESNLIEAQSLGITLKIKDMVDETTIIYCDKFLLTQALNNILRNAIDFTSKNGEIVITTSEHDEFYSIEIKDTGTGIPDYALDKIFERFYSLPRPNNKMKSSGLGLSFVNEVAMLHHGSLTVENRTDKKGTIARLSIRLV